MKLKNKEDKELKELVRKVNKYKVGERHNKAILDAIDKLLSGVEYKE